MAYRPTGPPRNVPGLPPLHLRLRRHRCHDEGRHQLHPAQHRPQGLWGRVRVRRGGPHDDLHQVCFPLALLPCLGQQQGGTINQKMCAHIRFRGPASFTPRTPRSRWAGVPLKKRKRIPQTKLNTGTIWPNVLFVCRLCWTACTHRRTCSRASRYTPWAVQFTAMGVAFDSAHPPARTPHGADV